MSETDKTTVPEKREKPPVEVWINRTTAILAVLAALSSGRWGASNLWAILEQGKVNDAWSYFQAKSVKQHVAVSSGNLAEALHADVAIVESFRAESRRLEDDKTEAKKEAEKFQTARDLWVERSFWFEISFALIQLGVVICTIATANSSKRFWAFAMILGLCGLGVFFHGLFTKERSVDNILTKGAVKAMDGSKK